MDAAADPTGASTAAPTGASTPAAIGASTPPEPYTLMTCAHHPLIQHVPCEGCVSVSGRILCARARGWRKVKAKSGINWWCPECNASRFTPQWPPETPAEPEDCCLTNHGDEDARWWTELFARCGVSASTPVLPPRLATPEPAAQAATGSPAAQDSQSPEPPTSATVSPALVPPTRLATGSPAPTENDPAMEERLRSLEEQLERVTAQLTQRVAALETSGEQQLERLTAQLTERVARAARVTDVKAQLTKQVAQVSALGTACAEHGARLAYVERRTNELSEERESLRRWAAGACSVPQQLMDDRNLGLQVH